MIQGFIVDWAQGGARRVSSWVEGAPEKTFWSGINAPDDKQIPVATFRCSACGYLESFARLEFAAS